MVNRREDKRQEDNGREEKRRKEKRNKRHETTMGGSSQLPGASSSNLLRTEPGRTPLLKYIVNNTICIVTFLSSSQHKPSTAHVNIFCSPHDNILGVTLTVQSALGRPPWSCAIETWRMRGLGLGWLVVGWWLESGWLTVGCWLMAG